MNESAESPLDDVIDEAAARARAGLDFATFETWLVERLAGRLERRDAASLARALWRVMPLESNDYRGHPLPEPGRNEPCFCGSGEKYKQCCERRYRDTVDALNPEIVWDAMLPAIPPDTVARLARQGRVPLWPLGEYAQDLVEDGQLEQAAACLAPALQAPFRHVDEDAAALLADLDALYGDLEDFDAQDELLQTVVEQAPRSPLRAEACHLLAQQLADEGAWPDALELLHEAVEDAPADVRFGVLEIRLLVALGHVAEAREAAGEWLAMAEESPPEAIHPDERELMLGFYRQAGTEPSAALLQLALGQLPAGRSAFLQELAAIAQRPLPHYPLLPVDAPPSGDIPPDARVMLVSPPALEDLERDWRKLFPLSKPLGEDDGPADARDAWESPEWQQFLADRPEAWDSLWVLDDVATAIAQLEYPGVVTWTRAYRVTVLQRAADIVGQAMGGRAIASLPWECPENRPALRSLRRLGELA